MTAPNLKALTETYIQTATGYPTTSELQLVACPTGHAYEVKGVYVSNVGTVSAAITITFHSTGAGSPFGTIRLPKGRIISPRVTLNVLQGVLYLAEGESLYMSASVNSAFEIAAPYIDYTDQ
jgi:hypothetical protein